MFYRNAFLIFVCVAPMLIHPQPTMACTDTVVKDTILGVNQNGDFAIHRFGEGGADCSEDTVIIYNADGAVVATYSSNTMSSEDCQNQWSGEGALPAPVIPKEETDPFLLRLKQTMRLTPLKKSYQRMAVEQSDDILLRVYLISSRGWYPVWEVTDAPFGDKPKVTFAPKKHKHSKLLFLTYSYTSGQSCRHTEESVHWVHPDWVKATTWYRRAASFLRQGKYLQAQHAAINALQLHSGLVQAHMVLAKSLLYQKVPFAEAKQTLIFNHQSHLPCETTKFIELITLLYSEEFIEWNESPDFEDWLDKFGTAHDELHQSENNPLTSWGPNEN